MAMITTFSFPTKIIFGPGALDHLSAAVHEIGGKRPLLVTDKGVIASGIVEQIQTKLKQANLNSAIFDEVASNPVEANVAAGVACYKDATCDCLIAVGGGSPLDMGKAIALMSTHAWPMEQYDDKIDGWQRITSNVPRVITIPTTAGTGSEVGRSAVITLKSTQRKTVIFSPNLMPRVALCDPMLTLKLPPKLTAATGMDALTHCLEAYVSKGYHPMCDGIALQGLKLIARSLVRAVEHGEDLEARSDMMMAASMGAVAFQKGLGVCHSLAHPLSTIAGLHHGLANAIMLPYVLAFNQSAVAERLADVAAALTGDRTRNAADIISEMNKRIGIPARLSEVGVRREQIPALTEQAFEDACHLLNPRPVAKEDLRALYEAAM
ncbi:iron-containing alcohol dehydrogenase [candidate division KSB1 bacterium]|nr:iron-containing alcohol dehydrogenase [candidate division KSB1 bacterium]